MATFGAATTNANPNRSAEVIVVIFRCSVSKFEQFLLRFRYYRCLRILDSNLKFLRVFRMVCLVVFCFWVFWRWFNLRVIPFLVSALALRPIFWLLLRGIIRYDCFPRFGSLIKAALRFVLVLRGSIPMIGCRAEMEFLNFSSAVWRVFFGS